MRSVLVLLCLIFSCSVFGQKNTSISFHELLEKAQAYYAQPLETFFKSDNVRKNDVLQYDHALKGRKADLEIRYKVIPIPADSPAAFAPQVKMTSMAMNLASNDEDEADMVFHRIDEEDIKPYNADFGLSVFFQPKGKFSEYKHCKATFLYAEGKGMLCTFLLFDRTDLDLSIYEQNLSFSKGSL